MIFMRNQKLNIWYKDVLICIVKINDYIYSDGKVYDSFKIRILVFNWLTILITIFTG